MCSKAFRKVKELEAKSKAQGTSLPATPYSPEGKINPRIFLQTPGLGFMIFL